MTTARVFVRAIVVTDGRSRFLDEVLQSLAAQDFAPDSVHVAAIGGVTVPAQPGLTVQVTPVPEPATFGEAVDAVIAAFPEHDAEYLWLLHDDSAPLPDALGRLAATAKKRSRAAIVGAAQVRWRDSSRLISLGSTVSRYGARRVDLVDDSDINQGQYDSRDDVLSVSLPGSLVRRSAWVDLGGLDNAYRGFGDSADLCRRAWRAGHDVVVVPGALVRHAQLNLRGRREGSNDAHASYALRRTGEWYHALVWAPLAAVPFIVLWAFLSALVRALLRVAQNAPRLALTDLGVPWRLVGRLVLLPGSRWRARRHAEVSARSIRRLLASPASVLHYVRTRYLRSYDRWRNAVTPTNMERAELAASGTRRRWMLALVIATSAGGAMAIFGEWLPALLAGDMLTGRALGVTDIGWHDLWQRSWSGWSEAGYGAPALDGTFAAALLPFAIVPGGLRLWLGLILTFGVVWASITAWFAAGAATRAVSVRAVAALAYGFWPLFLVSISQGRVGAVLAHIMLPLVALGVARSLGVHRGEALSRGHYFTQRVIASPSAAAAAALALAFVVAVSPVVLVPAVVALIATAAVAGRRWPRIVLIAAPAIVISGPALFAALRADSLAEKWGILAREVGPAARSEVASPLRTVLGLDTTPGGEQWYSSPWVVALIATVVSVGALLALLSGRAVRAVHVGWFVAALGVLTALASQRVMVSWPDGAGIPAANGWAGPGLSLALVGALAAATAAAHNTWHSGGMIRVRRTGAVVVVTLAAIAVLASATAWAWPGRAHGGDVRAANADVLPLVASLEQLPPASARVLTLTDTEDGVAYSVENGDGAMVLSDSVSFGPNGAPLARPERLDAPSPADLDAAVATLVGAGVGADERLAAWGIGVIVATPDSPRALAGLSQVDTLALIGASELGTAYRIGAAGQAGRAWLETSGGERLPIAWEGRKARAKLLPGESGTAVLAVPADEGWQATLAGRELEPVTDDEGRQAFAVPAGGGSLEIRFVDHTYRSWWWAAAIACGLALLAAAPAPHRRILGVRS